MWIKDNHGNFLAANKPCERIFGVEPDELIGLKESDFLGIADAHRSHEFDEVVYKTLKGVSYTHYLGRNELAESVIDMHKEPLFDEHGEIIGVCTHAHNASTEVNLHIKFIRAATLMQQAEDVHQLGH